MIFFKTFGSPNSKPYLIFFKTYTSFHFPDQPFSQSEFPYNSALSTNHKLHQPLSDTFNLSYSEQLTDSMMLVLSNQPYMTFPTTYT